MPSIPSYRSSGKFEPSTFPYALGLGLVGALGVGWLYQLFVDWVPLIFLSALVALGFGALLGALVGWGARMGKCRNMIVVTLLVGVVAVVAEGATMYYAYQRTVSKVMSKQLKALKKYAPNGEVTPKMRKALKKRLEKRLTFQRYLEARVKVGWKVRRSLTISGAMVYVVWGIEFLMLLVLGALVARSMINVPFCERGNRWADEQELGAIPGVDPGIARDALRDADLGFFVSPGDIPVHEDLPTTLTYTLYLCQEAGYLSVTLVTETLDKKGEAKSESEDLLEHAQVDSTQVERLRSFFAV